MPVKQASRTTHSDTYTSDQLLPLLQAMQAAKAGDFSVRLPETKNGVLSQIAKSFNEVISLNEHMAHEIVRVARTVGREGRMTERATFRGAEGSWAVSTQGINSLIEDLARPTTEVARVITAVADGDLSQKMALEIEGTPVKGEFLRIGTTVNTMVDQLGSFAAEVTRVAREVGTEGKLGGQAEVPGVSGTWKDLTDNVNLLAGNLTNQVRNIALVTTAVANGDLSQKITVDARGEILELKKTINTMVDQLNSFAAEVTRVAREVGTEGKLGGQAQVPGVSGTWKDLTDSVNNLAGNLTNQVRNIALVTTAVANGDLSQKITVDVQGEILELKNTINSMVDQLNSFAAEVTRVAREVGTDGKLGGQAEVKGVSGTWKDLTDNVNLLAGNLTNQVRNIALVTTAVANGDLSQKITVDVKGEILELKNTINTMVDQLRSFADEVTRVAREVGTEGKLGGQAKVPGVSGTWKDLTDSVNTLAGNLTNQVRNIALVTTAVANGDLNQKITVDVKGEILELKDTINTMVDQLGSFAAEVTRVAREVGTEGKLGGQAQVSGVSGTWKDLTDNVNSMASNLTTQVRGIVKVVTAVANGDLSQQLVVDAKGEVAALADTINSMIDTLSIFAEQVTTVAREVGTEGILGGQAKVPNVAGTWKDLTDNVNFMASNLTTQVRGIAKVVAAVANGDLRQKLVVEAKGEIAALADTINSVTDTLSIFAEQVTTVAREVGTEGILGGQAKVPNVAGTWKDLTDNVNFMANSLTVQVRAISDVATAVTEGDLTRFITVEAQGEVAALKNKINQMIANLKETTRQNAEQDWLKTNLARFSGLMQGQKSLEAVARLIMSELTPLVSAHHGVFYIADTSGLEPVLKLLSSYGFNQRKNIANRFELGESLIGQCALEKKSILLTNVPPNYITINSGLGEAPPLNIIVLPVLFEGEIMAVIELASFQEFSQIHKTFLDQLMESVGVVLNMISANVRTEELLQQSQSLTQELQSQSQELQSQQEQLKKTNIELEAQAKELEEKASLLAEQNEKVEMKNREVELARAALEEKAEQLALSSKYKSEFLANMSHELRTPLNSMLILAKLLADNPENNLSSKQVEFANTIHGSGGDLLNLINEILDLSKVEAGKMEIEVTEVALAELCEQLERSFMHVAQQKGLAFSASVVAGAPRTITTDAQRLQQVLRNLLSNAFKFTEAGEVRIEVRPAGRDVILDTGELMPADRMVAISVKDTGIGIAKNKHNLIFEAFQQADGTTNRRFGGTGLGLSISKEITKLLGGRIQVESQLNKGSEFVLFLPLRIPGEYNLDSAGGQFTGAFSKALSAPIAWPAVSKTSSPSPSPRSVPDDRDSVNTGDKVLLIVEDDAKFAKILLDLARSQSFKGIVALSGETAIELAGKYRPDAITLDLRLEGIDGWTVLEHLKSDPQTRHIPVQVISVVEKHKGSLMGAHSYLEKPVSQESLKGGFEHLKNFVGRDRKELLVVEDDQVQRDSIVQFISNDDVAITAVSNAEQALKALKGKQFDCMVLDLTLPDMQGVDLIKRVKRQVAHRDLPVVVYTSKDLTAQEERQLKKFASSIIIKDATSADRLLDDTAMLLHRSVARMSPSQQKIVESLRLSGSAAKAEALADAAAHAVIGGQGDYPKPGEGLLAGLKVLIIDDDIRNIFALTGLLETEGASVLFNESGKAALGMLRDNPGVSLVIMDIMMPEMDGIETMRAIRGEHEFVDLPIIALTAKALEGDREKCLEAGANDYLAKPADNDDLLRTIKKWTSVAAGRN